MVDLKDYGFKAVDSKTADDIIPARIIEVHRELYKAICAHGEVSAKLKGSFLKNLNNREDYPAVGDFVHLIYNPIGESKIVKLLPRKSKFSRTDLSGHNPRHAKTVLEQVVAANFDYVFIMSSLNQDFNANRISRYLTQAYQSRATPVVILTKSDLCPDYEDKIEKVKALSNDLDVIAVSSQTGAGIDEVAKYLGPGITVVFLGMSGVGKSSLVNALANEEIMLVNDILLYDDRGRHTTTHRQLVKLNSGAMIIDTPGMRELGLWDADEAIGEAFADIEELICDCRFSNCSHKSEPGCQILLALENGTLSQKRWKSYLTQKKEAEFVKTKLKKSSKKKSKII